MDNPVVWLVIAVYLLAPVVLVFLLRLVFGARYQWVGIVLGGSLTAAPWLWVLLGAALRAGSLDPCVMWKSAPEVCIMNAWPEMYISSVIAFAYGAGAAGAFVMFVKRKLDQ